MPAKNTFALGDNDSLDANMKAFGDFLVSADAELGTTLKAELPRLHEEAVPNSEIWDVLFESAAPKEPVAGAAAASTPQPGHPNSAAGQSVPASSIAGWLLENISIEGFRGINNQGKPLELKFHVDKVNSVSAANGVGKSSIFDAIGYAISSRIKWLDELPPAERDGEYYLNKFNSSGTASIKLNLIAEPNGERCQITVVRDRQGVRTVTADRSWNAEEILRSLNREFVLLDGRTFQSFISAKPIDRGRTFSGLLGLLEYSKLRQALAALANTRAFNNHFGTSAHNQTRAREEKSAGDFQTSIARDFESLVGSPMTGTDTTGNKVACHKALAQIAPLAEHCNGKTFAEIDVDVCIEAIKQAEGGAKRERLGACVRERGQLAELNVDAPGPDRAAKIVERAAEQEVAHASTAGDIMLELYQLGIQALDLPAYTDPTLCPLCDNKSLHDLRSHINEKLSKFSALEDARQSLALEWNEAGWAGLLGLEKVLEADNSKRQISRLNESATNGTLKEAEAKELVAWLEVLRTRANERDAALAKEQAGLEGELPQSSTEVTKKVETARRLQANWLKMAKAEANHNEAVSQLQRINRVKEFLDNVSDSFAIAEAGMSKARLAAVEPVFKTYFENMSIFGIVPSVSKRADSEELQIRLSDFYGLTNLSPQALLSESFRNAFAISLYLAAASLYGGLPKFVILDDVTSSFDAGHQNFLVELVRTTFGRPGNSAGPQVILLSHDTMLEKLFNKHSNSGSWWHQRLEGVPQFAVLPQAGAVNKVRDQTISMLQAGQVDSAKEGVRQYLEYRLSDLISRLRIPVPVDIAFNDNKQLSGEFLNAIDAAVKLHQAANSLSLEPTQVSGLNTNMVTIVSNFLSHWGTGQTLSFTGQALLGVMQAIDRYCDCFMFEPTPGAARVFYKSLRQKC